ncbi:MAG TPA: urate oxidase [Candidatus Limnocylindrales bacterium]|jgi:urate oxidase|nr:urate oxidase [Candidatus Limnocylindrales bacterium]
MTEPGPELAANRYGKSAIRLVKIVRGGDRHAIRDLTVAIALEGDFAASYVDGDNSLVVATDTMKNTVYALAREHLTGPVEAFGTVLARHFVAIPQVERATVSIEEQAWRPIGEAPDAFSRDRSSTRTAVVAATRGGLTVDAGIADLTLMKTAKSAFAGFPRDEYTTLPDTTDRLMATKLSATWRYGAETDFDASFDAIVNTLLEVFAAHESASVQHSIWLVGRAIIDRHAEVAEVTLTLPNLHHWLADLSPFGQPNDREIFIATTEPHGLIQATVRRGE